jgi:hypothetical protein
MVRKSYIERQVEMLGQVLARILGMKERGDASGALEAVRAGGRQLAGMDLDTLARLSDEAVLSLLTNPRTGVLDAAKAVIAACPAGRTGPNSGKSGRDRTPRGPHAARPPCCFPRRSPRKPNCAPRSANASTRLPPP